MNHPIPIKYGTIKPSETLHCAGFDSVDSVKGISHLDKIQTRIESRSDETALLMSFPIAALAEEIDRLLEEQRQHFIQKFERWKRITCDERTAYALEQVVNAMKVND